MKYRRRNRSEDDPEDAATSEGDRPAEARVPRDRALLHTLETAEIIDCQLVPWGSNYTFAVALAQPESSPLVAIYKPRSGEVPLWDFESGTLYRREYASYLLSRVLGWHFIPPTVIRDGPHGIGTVQLYVEPSKVLQGHSLPASYLTQLGRIFMFDLITNNADRKMSHFFVGRDDGRLWGIDHGLTFHAHPKLRTVIWEFCGKPVGEELRAPLAALTRRSRQVKALLAQHLADDEIRMLFRRIETLRDQTTFPLLNQRRNIPYGW